MVIQRVPGPPRVILSDIEGSDSPYEILLTAIPSPEWRAAFVRSPGRLTSAQSTPDVGLVTVQKRALHFRTASPRLAGWLRQLDRWIAYANSVVAE